jgi:citronellol/citronellal dehydrogenase
MTSLPAISNSGRLLSAVTGRALGGEAMACPADLQKKGDREKLAEAALSAYGHVDILVNNAAILVPGTVLDFPERYYDRMFEILVKAPFHLCQLLLPGMVARKTGSVLNISSSAARHPKPDQRSYDGAVYGMTKAAIERFTTGLASEMYEHRVSVNSLSPDSYIATPGQMFGRKYTQAMIDNAEPVELISDAALKLVTGDPQSETGASTTPATSSRNMDSCQRISACKGQSRTDINVMEK